MNNLILALLIWLFVGAGAFAFIYLLMNGLARIVIRLFQELRQ